MVVTGKAQWWYPLISPESCLSENHRLMLVSPKSSEKTVEVDNEKFTDLPRFTGNGFPSKVHP